MLSVNTPTNNNETGEPLKCSVEFTEIAQETAMAMLSDSEARVRIAAGLLIKLILLTTKSMLYIHMLYIVKYTCDLYIM